MRIAIDARTILPGRTGVGKYVEGLLHALAALDRRHEFFVCSHRPIDFEPPNERWHRRVISRGLPLIDWATWPEECAGQLARRDRIDVFWGTYFTLPLTLPRRVKTLLTVLDLVPLRWAHTMRWKTRVRLTTLFPSSLRRADRVVTISDTIAREVAGLGFPRERIAVAPPGLGGHLRAVAPEIAARELERRHGLGGRYVLSVGTREPRKNLATLVRAFASLPRELRASAPLVLVGATGWQGSELGALVAPLVADRTIRLLGYVPDEHLPWLYAGATLLAFPTLYEGFGMPAVEAMAAGTPTLLSDIPVLREVAGEAAAFVPPLEAAAWAHALGDLLADDARRGELARRGLERARAFTFERSAAVVLEALESLVRAG